MPSRLPRPQVADSNELTGGRRLAKPDCILAAPWLDHAGIRKLGSEGVGDSVDYCDRQGCLQSEAERRILPDGCEVGVCERHLIHFREDATGAGVYFHACTVKD